MAQPQLQAQFFVTPAGIAFPKARPLSIRQRKAIYERDNRKCKRCGVKVAFGGTTVSPFDEKKAGAIDHILARARGGQNEEANLRLLCITCNAQKGAK